MEITKDMLGLVDALLERVRAQLFSNLNFGAEVEGRIDISGDMNIEEKIDEHLQPAVQALAIALRLAQFGQLNVERFLWESPLYFPDEDGDVRVAQFMDIERVWRPMPPGPDYKIDFKPPEDVEIPEPIDPSKMGPVQ